jgi:hypothetical protein
LAGRSAPETSIVVAPQPAAALSTARKRLRAWLQAATPRAAAVMARAEARITEQFKVPPGGG